MDTASADDVRTDVPMTTSGCETSMPVEAAVSVRETAAGGAVSSSASNVSCCADASSYSTADDVDEGNYPPGRKGALRAERQALLDDDEEEGEKRTTPTSDSDNARYSNSAPYCLGSCMFPYSSHVRQKSWTDLDFDPANMITLPTRALDKAEELARHVMSMGWTVVHHSSLPKWLRDNDFLIRGHRPPLQSFKACFKSIFRIHTETGNIWTHLLAFVAFIGVATYFLTRPSIEVQWQEKAIFSAFFAGAILCMGFSWLFHTVYCHSERVGKIFNKLDYCGIALLTMGSFVPWLYYSFYCRISPKIFYNVLIFVLGTGCIIVSMWDKFSEPKYRPVRAGLFIALGLSGVIPAVHYCITDGFHHAFKRASLGWLVLMAVLYIGGALIYAVRVPERIWPGKFDIWFSSHQIFHLFVIAAAFVHLHGISQIANYRLSFGNCLLEQT